MFPYRPSASLSALLLLAPALYAQAPARTMTVPTGATIPIRLTRVIDTRTAKQGDAFEGTVAANVFSGASVALPIGTPVNGRIAAARAAGRLGTPADLILELVSVQANGQTIPVSSRQLSGRRPNSTSPMNGNAALGTLLAGGQQIVITTDILLQFQNRRKPRDNSTGPRHRSSRCSRRHQLQVEGRKHPEPGRPVHI